LVNAARQAHTRAALTTNTTAAFAPASSEADIDGIRTGTRSATATHAAPPHQAGHARTSADPDALPHTSSDTAIVTSHSRHTGAVPTQRSLAAAAPPAESALTASTDTRTTRPIVLAAATRSGDQADPGTIAPPFSPATDRSGMSGTAPVVPTTAWYQPQEWQSAAGARSQAGGLLFLLPLLARLGLPAWCQDEAAAASRLSRNILRLALLRLRIPTDDPVWPLLTTPMPDSADSVPDASFGLDTAQPPVWLQAAWWTAIQHMPPDAEPAACCWLHAARCWLRRVGGIGLASLVCRPGHLVLTSTHVDVHFGLNDADLRVRRLGLDCDPGWLPWFGRVVNFHYGNDLA
jgi:hypothetical protein